MARSICVSSSLWRRTLYPKYAATTAQFEQHWESPNARAVSDEIWTGEGFRDCAGNPSIRLRLSSGCGPAKRRGSRGSAAVAASQSETRPPSSASWTKWISTASSRSFSAASASSFSAREPLSAIASRSMRDLRPLMRLSLVGVMLEDWREVFNQDHWHDGNLSFEPEDRKARDFVTRRLGSSIRYRFRARPDIVATSTSGTSSPRRKTTNCCS